MSIKKLFTGLAVALAFTGLANAGPIVFPSVNLDPTGVLANQTAGNLQQVCPTEQPNNCFAGSPFVSPDDNAFEINMLNDGLFSASIVESITPGSTGLFTTLIFFLLDAADNILATGDVLTPIQDLVLQAGTYRMFVFYEYFGFQDNGSAAWAMTMTTSPFNDVPEPGTLALMGLALLGLAMSRRKRG